MSYHPSSHIYMSADQSPFPNQQAQAHQNSSRGATPTNPYYGSPYQQVTDPRDNPNYQWPLTLAQSQEQGLCEPVLRRPWWLWLFGIVDLVISVASSVSVGFSIAEKGVKPGADREKLMFNFFMSFVSYLVEFLMGAALLFGLYSSKRSMLAFTLQGWLYGAYFLLVERIYFLFSYIMKFTSTELDEKASAQTLGYIIGNFTAVVLRGIAILIVRKFLNNMRAQDVMHNIRREQRRSFHIPEQLLPIPANNSNGANNEIYYYAPQMSHMMGMMIS